MATVTIAVVFTPHNASAQMEFMSEVMRPEYMTRDLVVFAELLNLDDTQEVIVEAMFDSYEYDFQNGWATTQERLNRIAEEMKKKSPASNRESLEPILNAIGDWVVEKQSLDVGLLDNVNAILVSDQQQLWPSFIQRLYREKHMHRGRLSGEAVDLFFIVRDSNLSSSAELVIEDYLSEYAIALDIAMRNRDAILRGNPKKLFDNILSGNSNRPLSLVENLIKARLEVRNLNDQYINIIGDTLLGKDSDDFVLRAFKRGYPRVFRRTPAQRILRQAAENENYTPALRAQITLLEGAYLQELADINKKLLDLTRKHEPEVHINRELAGQIRRNGGTPQKLEDPTRNVYKKREELGKRYIEMLRDLLSDEEFLELDGSRRWIPRSEQTLDIPPSPVTGPDGGLSLSGGGGAGKSKKDGSPSPKGSPIPDPTGLGNPKGGS